MRFNALNMMSWCGAVALLVFAPPLSGVAAGPYVLKGRIADLGDKPLAEVRVGFRSAGVATHTNEAGEFELTLKPARALTQDNTKTYEWVELDKEGYLGRTIEIKDLAAFSRPLNEKLELNPVTEDRAEFTVRMDVEHLLPAISAPKDFSLIQAEEWRKFFSEMDVRKENPAARTEQVSFQAYAPKAAKKLKAVFLLTRHGIGSIDHPRLRAFADRNHVALVGVNGNPVQRGFYPVNWIDEHIARLGRMLSRPELAALPRITFGHSNGTGFAGIFASRQPERVIAWISYHSGSAWHLQFPGVEKVPGLVMHGLIDPFFKNGQMPTVKNLRRERNAALAMMLEANVAHGPVDKGQNATWDFIAAFAEAAMRIRLNDDGTLKPVSIEAGWLGAPYDADKGGQQELTISPYADFTGDRATATWLPDQAFAEVWQAYGKTDPRPAR